MTEQKSKQYPAILNQFMQDKKLGYSERTLEGYLNHITQFLQYIKRNRENKRTKDISVFEISDFTIEDIKQITNKDVKSYIKYCSEKRENSNSTIDNKISAIQSFYEYLMAEELVQIDILKGITRPKLQKKQMEYLSLEEAKQFLDGIKNCNKDYKVRDYCIFTIFINCGNRLSELTGINMKDLDVKNKRIKVNGKGNKDRYLLLNSACINAINQYLVLREELINRKCMDKNDKNALFISERGSRISNRTLQDLVKEYARIAGIDDEKIHVHELRHTAATLLYKFGNVDVLRLQKMLGHESVSTTQIYTHVDEEQLQDAADSHPLANLL